MEVPLFIGHVANGMEIRAKGSWFQHRHSRTIVIPANAGIQGTLDHGTRAKSQ